MPQDPTYGINNFGTPKVLNESSTVVNNILTILMGKPGSFPSQPQLGMNISQYLYNFDDDVDTVSLKAQLAYQCSDFLDDIQNGDFDIIKTRDEEGRPFMVFVLPIKEIDSKTLVLGVTIDKNQYMIYNFQITESQVI